jgi:hypothetical protein
VVLGDIILKRLEQVEVLGFRSIKLLVTLEEFMKYKIGNLNFRIDMEWVKLHHFTIGQCLVMKHNRELTQAILYSKIKIRFAIYAPLISLDDGPIGYLDFDQWLQKKCYGSR